ncbi:MAG: DUF4190 domain-containing protein [Christensenellales bacterium]
MTIEQVLNKIYQEQGTLALNDYNLFKNALVSYYQPAFKMDCKLMDQASMVGMGNLVAQFVQIGRGPNPQERAKLENQLTSLSSLNPNEAARVVDLYGYMVGWYPLYQSAPSSASNAPWQSASATVHVNPDIAANGYGIASLVLGVLSLLIALLAAYLYIIGAIIGLVGIILGAVGMKKNPSKKGLAVAGLVCSIIGLVISMLYLVACGSCGLITSHMLDGLGF